MAAPDLLTPQQRLQIPQVELALRTTAIGRDLHYLRVTNSTMDDARRLAEADCPHGATVVADEQTAGRGTKGRSWVSPPGQSIHTTLVVRPSAEQMRRLSIVTPVAVAQAVEQVSGLRPRLKWPNDVEINRHKFGGILIEGEWRSDGPTYALIGIGVNVNFDPAPHAAQIDRPATSLMIEPATRPPASRCSPHCSTRSRPPTTMPTRTKCSRPGAPGLTRWDAMSRSSAARPWRSKASPRT